MFNNNNSTYSLKVSPSNIIRSVQSNSFHINDRENINLSHSVNLINASDSLNFPSFHAAKSINIKLNNTMSIKNVAKSSVNNNKSIKSLMDRSTADIMIKKNKVPRVKYSRNGCSECKRRKMKCDEGKPSCWRCTRLDRKCIYILNTRNKKKPLNKSEDLKRTNDTPTMNIPASISPTPLSMEYINAYDANLLLQDLNDIVNMKLNHSSIHEDSKLLNFSDLDVSDLDTFSTSNNSCLHIPTTCSSNNEITFNISLDSFSLSGVHSKYLKVFYFDCLDYISPFFQNQSNPLRDILLSFARHESYLLSAVIAVGASVSHRQTGNLDDEKAYFVYLSHCLHLLNEQFKNENNVLIKIEPIILTVMMLTWDCIYTMDSQWRSHLKGVTELFKKTNSKNPSKVLNVAKSWFKVIETFATISTPFGGALNDKKDLDVIFDPYDYQYTNSLKFLNIITPLKEFNLLRGHKEDFDLVIKEVSKALNIVRHIDEKSSKENDIFDENLNYLLYLNSNAEINKAQLSYFNIQKILVEIDKQLEYEFIDKSGIIPITNQFHPNNSKTIDNAIDLVTLKNGETIAISWYDISHQSQVLSFLLIILLKLLGIPKESTVVQQIVEKIVSFFLFVDSSNPPRNSRSCYCNFAILIAGLNAINENTRQIIKKYYSLNGSRFLKLTEHNLKRLQEVWYGENGKCKAEDLDILTW